MKGENDMKMPKIGKSLGVAIAFAVLSAIEAFSDDINKHLQEKKIEDLENRMSKLENKE